MRLYSIDRFENEFALCETPEENIEALSREVLPEEAKEGDLIYLTENGWKIDQEATQKRRAILLEKLAKLKRK